MLRTRRNIKTKNSEVQTNAASSKFLRLKHAAHALACFIFNEECAGCCAGICILHTLPVIAFLLQTRACEESGSGIVVE